MRKLALAAIAVGAISAGNMSAIRFIQQTASATVNVSFYA